MINYLKTIETYKKGSDWLFSLEDNFSIDLFDSPIAQSLDAIFDEWLEQNFNEEGCDLVYWWLFEDVEKVITVDDKDVNVADLEEFVKYLIDNGYTKDN